VLKSEKASKFTTAKASSTSLYIGKGYVNNFSGLIDDVCIWNRALTAEEISAVVSSVSFVAPRILRDAKLDSVRPLDGSVLLGTIANKDWSITTSYGKFKIPAARVVGFVVNHPPGAATSRPAGSSDVQLLLIDGHVLAGKLSASLVQLKWPSGQILKIPISQTWQCGYRIVPEKPAIDGQVFKVDAKFPATAVLRSGDRLAWDSSGVKIRLKTASRTLVLDAKIISTITAAGNNMLRVTLKDSSVILGTPTSDEMKLKLKLGKEISVPYRNIASLTFPGAPVKPTDAATVLLGGGARLVGKLGDKKLAVSTDSGSVDVSMANIWKILRHTDGKVELTMQNLTVLRGKLKTDGLAMILGSGVKLNVPISQINSITFPRTLPADLIAKIEELIKELGDTSAAKRKAASQQLIAMGKDILLVLQRHRGGDNAMINKGLQRVIDTLDNKAARVVWRKSIFVNGSDLRVIPEDIDRD
jgi:hypothetical protein